MTFVSRFNSLPMTSARPSLRFRPWPIRPRQAIRCSGSTDTPREASLGRPIGLRPYLIYATASSTPQTKSGQWRPYAASRLPLKVPKSKLRCCAKSSLQFSTDTVIGKALRRNLFLLRGERGVGSLHLAPMPVPPVGSQLSIALSTGNKGFQVLRARKRGRAVDRCAIAPEAKRWRPIAFRNLSLVRMRLLSASR